MVVGLLSNQLLLQTLGSLLLDSGSDSAVSSDGPAVPGELGFVHCPLVWDGCEL